MEGMVKPGISNFFVVGLLAVLFILGAKVIFTKWEVPYVSKAVQAV